MSIYLKVKDWAQIYAKLPEIKYLCETTTDDLVVEQTYMNHMNELFKPRVFKSLKGCSGEYNIETFTLPPNISRDDYEFKPLVYVIGGLLGDFVHELGVVHRQFIKTGRRGIVYLSNQGDTFRNGLEATYKETYNIIMIQPYIKNYFIYQDQPVDINLSKWRQYPGLYHLNWYYIFKNVYGVEWGVNPWVYWPHKDPVWDNTILVNTTEYRFMSKYDFKTLVDQFGERVRFICFDEKQYDHFSRITGLGDKVPCYRLRHLEELLTALRSCTAFIGSFSAPFAFAMSMHIQCIGDIHKETVFFDRLNERIPIAFNCMPDELHGLNLSAKPNHNEHDSSSIVLF